jgi:hypothetical protein
MRVPPQECGAQVCSVPLREAAARTGCLRLELLTCLVEELPTRFEFTQNEARMRFSLKPIFDETSAMLNGIYANASTIYNSL